jgi:hypothetical protein
MHPYTLMKSGQAVTVQGLSACSSEYPNTLHQRAMFMATP